MVRVKVFWSYTYFRLINMKYTINMCKNIIAATHDFVNLFQIMEVFGAIQLMLMILFRSSKSKQDWYLSLFLNLFKAFNKCLYNFIS